jgi:hypothetical protein
MTAFASDAFSGSCDANIKALRLAAFTSSFMPACLLNRSSARFGDMLLDRCQRRERRRRFELLLRFRSVAEFYEPSFDLRSFVIYLMLLEK